MQINITFRHLDSSPGLKEYVNKRISKLAKYFNGPVEANVILKAEKFRQQAEVSIVGDGFNINGKEETGDMYEAIDLVVAKLETQIKKLREKRKGRKKGTTKEFEVASIVAEEASEEGPEIEVERVFVKPMSVEEALEQIKTTGKDFLIFNNSETDSVSVLYKKGENRYVLVLPELS
ncbi:sigma 54 modulation protein/ribosomal protein S30EA [Thermodesulfatator indicus DSM 15286]|uniref:Ribosome hibernation promoting factor n=1 Tax=Thermodesulfatator indicus (strain DSM 15286 / JCM 11887 / CIR29812) TaxID=667014 RepID=F8A9N8_THEID|nr:ribosome-associated translation inhibitor RaiA [Thermodesulfatator indicus]AEH45269.1 sigma 54 modulation protein/ribosomal protein S30EA [Thermodesulfatator indicus DSM 15286]